MKKRKNPFALFLLLIFICAAPFIVRLVYKNFNPIDAIQPPKQKWTGIIKIWEIPTWDIGCGSRTAWMNKCIQDFEKKHRGVYIQTRVLDITTFRLYQKDPEQAKSILPDMISFGPGTINNADIFFSLNKKDFDSIKKSLIKSSEYNTKLKAVPWMMGSYGLLVNKELLSKNNIQIDTDQKINRNEFAELINKMNDIGKKTQKRKKNIYGLQFYQDPYRMPLSSFISHDTNNTSDQDINYLNKLFTTCSQNKDSDIKNIKNVWSDFASDKNICMMPVSQKEIYRIKQLNNKGKAFNYSVIPIPGIQNNENKLFIDQVQYLGIVNNNQTEKMKMCNEFLKLVIDQKYQKKLIDLGVFPVINTEKIYVQNEEMNVLEKSLNYGFNVPNAFKWSDQKSKYDSVLNDLFKGKKVDIGSVNMIVSH